LAALTGSNSSSSANSNKTSLVFLYNVTKDNINVCQTCNLIFSLVRNNQDLAEQVRLLLEALKFILYRFKRNNLHFSVILGPTFFSV
jgi:hypothetical protein